jgi:hypothetical protein
MTMRYLCLLHINEDDMPEPGSPEAEELFGAYLAVTEAMARAGVLVDSAPLRPVRSATTVRVRGGETLLTDGPYAELKEQLGGYTLLECADLDEALRWVAQLPAAARGAVEVRPVIAVRPS